MRITVTGANGYLGWVLVPLLVEDGHKVQNLNLRENFTFPPTDCLIHLAAITNYDKCQKDPDETWRVNYWLTYLLDQLRNCPVVFASSLSVYGKLNNELICDENVPVNPQTIYATTKAASEELLLKSKNCVIMRCATGFGTSPVMRWDVMPNDFVLRAVKTKQLSVYQGDALRSFLHVYDIASAFRFAVNNLDSMSNSIYNIGNESLNFTKRSLAQKIKAKTGCELTFREDQKDPDARDYYVSFEKIRKLGFDPSRSLDQGIDELIGCIN